MITRLQISNFQSLVNVDIALGPYVALVGSSDTGKSAVLRALRALLENWQGDAFIRYGEKACTVAVTLDDGTVVEWMKKRAVKDRGESGVYTVTRPDGTSERFEKTGSSPPEAVASLLRVTIDVADQKFTPGVMSQLDPPFLLSAAPRRRAEIFGAFDGSNIVLAAETILRRAQRTAQDDVKAAEREVERLDGALLPYEALPAALEALEAAESLAEALGARSARRDAAVALAAGLRAAQRAAERSAAEAQAWTLPPGLPSVDDLAARAERLAGERSLIARLGAAREGAQQAERTLAALPDLSEPVEALSRRFEHLASVRMAVTALTALYADRAALEVRIEDVSRETHAAQEELAACAGAPCPECGRPLEIEALA